MRVGCAWAATAGLGAGAGLGLGWGGGQAALVLRAQAGAGVGAPHHQKHTYNPLPPPPPQKKTIDLVERGFEWTVDHGQPSNTPHYRLPHQPPCCQLQVGCVVVVGVGGVYIVKWAGWAVWLALVYPSLP